MATYLDPTEGIISIELIDRAKVIKIIKKNLINMSEQTPFENLKDTLNKLTS